MNVNAFIVVCLFSSFDGFSQQKELQVNGKTIDYNVCNRINTVRQLPEITSGFMCDIRNVQIADDCMELTLVYGGCNGNLELMTDSVIDKNSHLNLKARWIEPSMCKSMTLVKVLFDLMPYKEMIKEKGATVKISGTDFELFYN